jgi:formiminotetrahydrofolate cyclodeaminase
MAETSVSRLVTSIARFAEEMDDGDAEPVSGAVAALVAAMAASLMAGAADRSREAWDEAAGARAQAQALRRRAARLAESDVAAYAVARDALRRRSIAAGPVPSSEDQETRDWRLGVAVEQAAAPPLELAATAADIAQLAAAIAARAAGDMRADAIVAAVLAAAAARAAAHLVQINLVVGGDQRPAALARSYADQAAAAAASADASDR